MEPTPPDLLMSSIAYGVVAWFLTQLTTQVFPFFEIPNSAVRFVVIALAVGFPIAMLLSWLYELTPEGIVRTEDLDPVLPTELYPHYGVQANTTKKIRPVSH